MVYTQNTDIAQLCTLKSAIYEVVQVRVLCGLHGAVLIVQSDSCREEGPAKDRSFYEFAQSLPVCSRDAASPADHPIKDG